MLREPRGFFAAAERSAAGGAPARPAKPACRFHASPGGCWYGDDCRFSHGDGDAGSAAAPAPAPAPFPRLPPCPEYAARLAKSEAAVLAQDPPPAELPACPPEVEGIDFEGILHEQVFGVPDDLSPTAPSMLLTTGGMLAEQGRDAEAAAMYLRAVDGGDADAM